MTLQQLEREMVAQPIRSLQYMLNRLSLRYDFLPALVPDGLFGERTLEAVMRFQRELHPPVTGVVDRETWQAILDEWLDLERELADPRQIRAFPPSAKVQAGSSHNYLLPVQAMFQSLSHVLDGLEPESIDGIHDAASVRNTQWLQEKAMLPQTGELDRETWDILARLYELFVISHIDLRRAAGFELLFERALVDRLDLHGTVLCFGIVDRAVLRLIADTLPLGGVDLGGPRIIKKKTYRNQQS